MIALSALPMAAAPQPLPTAHPIFERAPRTRGTRLQKLWLGLGVAMFIFWIVGLGIWGGATNWLVRDKPS